MRLVAGAPVGVASSWATEVGTGGEAGQVTGLFSMGDGERLCAPGLHLLATASSPPSPDSPRQFVARPCDALWMVSTSSPSGWFMDPQAGLCTMQVGPWIISGVFLKLGRSGAGAPRCKQTSSSVRFPQEFEPRHGPAQK